jgi:5-formyltetrahydrofolate cyclo-ligase
MLHGFQEDDAVAAAEVKRLTLAWTVCKMMYSDEDGLQLINDTVSPSESLADLFVDGSVAKDLMEFRLGFGGGQPDLQDPYFGNVYTVNMFRVAKCQLASALV